MAATVTEQVLHNGRRNLILKYSVAGIGGDSTALKMVDISTLIDNPLFDATRVDKIQWVLDGFSASLLWDTDVDEGLAELCTGRGELHFDQYGGLHTDGASQTGDILITTNGFATNDSGTIILYMKKQTGTASIVAQSPEPGNASLGITGYAPLTTWVPDMSAGSAAIEGLAPSVA